MKKNNPLVSIIIPYLNDVETLRGTIDSLYETIDIKPFEVIVVKDGGKEMYDGTMHRNMSHIEHPFNLGVGAAFDTGVNNARSENIILMGSDIRFQHNGWASRMLQVIDDHEKAVICTVCQSHTNKYRRYYGADVIFKVVNADITDRHPRKSDLQYRAALEGKWRSQTGSGVYQIPSLMGAFYGVKKQWYGFVSGFQLHYKWGVLEPYISLKTWRMGGEVLLDSDNVVEHIWREPRREADWNALAYNQYMVAGVVFGTYGIKYANFLCGDKDTKTPHTQAGMQMYDEKIGNIAQLALYIEQNAVMTPKELEQKMVEMSITYNREGCKYENPIKSK